MCRMSLKSGNLNLLEPSESHRACYGNPSKGKSPVTTHEDLGGGGRNVGLPPNFGLNFDGTVVSSMLRSHFNIKKISWYSLRWNGFQCNRMWTAGMGHLKISKDPTGNQSRNLPYCGAVPQATSPLALLLRNIGKEIPLQAWTWPKSSRRLMVSDYKTIGTWRW